MKINDNIYLIGFMGTGKSTIALELKNNTKKDIIEMDEMIVKNQGMTINEIFEKHGEEYFRKLETDLLNRICKEGNKIVSCGGGVAIREENVSIMKQSGKIICLLAEPETVFQRIKESKSRPILNENMNVEFISDLMDKRRKYYLVAADMAVKTDGKTIGEICREIVEYCND